MHIKNCHFADQHQSMSSAREGRIKIEDIEEIMPRLFGHYSDKNIPDISSHHTLSETLEFSLELFWEEKEYKKERLLQRLATTTIENQEQRVCPFRR